METMHKLPQGIQVTLKVFGGLRDAIGKPMVHVALRPPAVLAQLLDEVGEISPVAAADLKRGLQAGYLNVMVNGRIVPHSEREQVTLEDQDVVAFLPPVGGG